MLARLTTSKITVIHTHGSQTKITTSDLDIEINTLTSLADNALSCADLVLYGSCEAAKDGETNIVSTTVDMGARTAIGFKDKTSTSGFNYWSSFFFDYYCNNFNSDSVDIRDACVYANDEILYSSTLSYLHSGFTSDGTYYSLANYVIAGEESFNN